MLRVRSFGAIYEFPFRCQDCRAQFKARINLSDEDDMRIRYMEDDVVEPFEVKLPISGDSVHLRFLRGKDEVAVARHTKRVRLQSTDPGDPSHPYRLARQIVSINGEEAALAKAERFVRQLDMGDSNAMREETDRLEGGADPRIMIDCRACGFINEAMMPFSAEFFRRVAD